MLRYTGALCSGLGLFWFGPSFAQEVVTPPPAAQSQSQSQDPLTEAWFDTVQSIGVLEGLSRQLDVRKAGAVDNLRRNTESPLGDADARQARLDSLEREIRRLRSEFELLAKPLPLPEPKQADGPRAPHVQTPTVGLSDAGREAMLRAAREARPGVPVKPELPPIEVPDLPATADRFTGYEAPTRSDSTPNPQPVQRETQTPVAAPTEPNAAERRIAELEAQLVELSRRTASPPPSGPSQAEFDALVARLAEQSASGAGQPPAANSSALELPTEPPEEPEETGQEALQTTLVLGPLDAAGAPTPEAADTPNPAAASPGAAAPTSQPTPLAPSNPDVGTLPVADRIEQARVEAERRAAAQQAALAAAMTVEGYSADPVRQGRAAYFAGEYERAVSLLSREPDRTLAVYWLAKSLEKLDRESEALKAYQRVAASEDEPDLAERAQFDLEFLRWRWEHDQAFASLKETLQAERSR